MSGSEILTIKEMYRADSAAMGMGIPGLDLMESAGKRVFEEIVRRWSNRRVVVMAGPGNNGGDGYVVARLLKQAGWPVQVAYLGDPDHLQGDAAVNAERWLGESQPLSEAVLDGTPLVVDALFGAGLTRPLEGGVREVVERINSENLDCVAVDVPSGIHGDTGEILGTAPKSVVTVTFFRRKPGHLLLPGKEVAGDVRVVDIGIPDVVLDDINPRLFVNGPALWLDTYPDRQPSDNKYTHGHAVIVGGAEMPGAARLAATAARRIGAGLASIAVPRTAFETYAAGEPGNILKPVDDAKEFKGYLSDQRLNAVLVGPGCGLNERTRTFVRTAVEMQKQVVIDADGLTVYADETDQLFALLHHSKQERCLLTPHTGEFRRLFEVAGDKVSMTRMASAKSNAVVLLKGADTVIATPDGTSVINEDAPPTLATAGSGDVLAGFAIGLMAQGMAVFNAACAAVWLHGRAAASFGPGLIAEDLGQALSDVLRDLMQQRES